MKSTFDGFVPKRELRSASDSPAHSHSARHPRRQPSASNRIYCVHAHHPGAAVHCVPSVCAIHSRSRSARAAGGSENTRNLQRNCLRCTRAASGATPSPSIHSADAAASVWRCRVAQCDAPAPAPAPVPTPLESALRSPRPVNKDSLCHGDAARTHARATQPDCFGHSHG